MEVSPEGKIGIALGLLALGGGGAMWVAPDHTEIGWMMIGIAALGIILLAVHHFNDAIRRIWNSTTKTRMIAQLCMIVFGLGFIAATAIHLWPKAAMTPSVATKNSLINQPETGFSRPVLRIRPIASDIMVRWKLGEIMPEIEWPKSDVGRSPFSVTVTNVGDVNAIDVTIAFSVVLDKESLIQKIDESNIFHKLSSIDGPMHIQTVFDHEQKWWNIDFHNSGHQSFSVLHHTDPNGAVVTFSGVQEVISLWLLAGSFAIGKINFTHMNEEFRHMEEWFASNNFDALSRDEQRRMKKSIVECPEVKVYMSYSDARGRQFSEQQNIRSIYRPLMEAIWDGDPKHGIASLDGGSGTLSYEDIDNPINGFFNHFK